MKRQPPGDDAPWKDQRKRPRLPMPVDPAKVEQQRTKASPPKAVVKKEDALVSFHGKKFQEFMVFVGTQIF